MKGEGEGLWLLLEIPGMQKCALRRRHNHLRRAQSLKEERAHSPSLRCLIQSLSVPEQGPGQEGK